jgi:hypothetical protein
MTRRHDVDPARLRAQLHRLTQTIEPAPDYLDRLRPRLRPARRRRTAGAIAAAGLAVAVGAGAILVGLLVGDRQPPGEPPPGVPRTMVVGAVEARQPLDRGLLRRDPMRFQQLMEQYEKRRRSALLRLDTATGKVRSVLYRTQGRHLAWALGDDGTAAVETGNSKCAFDLTAVAPDGRATPLGTVPGFEGNTGSSIASFALSPDGRLLAVTGTSCPDPRRGAPSTGASPCTGSVRAQTPSRWSASPHRTCPAAPSPTPPTPRSPPTAVTSSCRTRPARAASTGNMASPAGSSPDSSTSTWPTRPGRRCDAPYDRVGPAAWCSTTTWRSAVTRPS